VRRHLNTLYVTTQGAYVFKEGLAVAVRVEGKTRIRVPVHNLASVVCFGNVSCSPFLMGFCGQNGVGLSFLTERGRYLARVTGKTSGNVLLRREQYRRADDPLAAAAIARAILVAKIGNSRTVLLRFLRDHGAATDDGRVGQAVTRLRMLLEEALRVGDLERLRGIEGAAARAYFDVFDDMIVAQKDAFSFRGRSRRPPKDPTNALLSFIYTLLVHDTASGMEAVGLDPAVGFLHVDRPGRPGLALDVLEEFRAFLGDRLALSLVNRQQLGPSDFRNVESGAVFLEEAGRKKVLAAYQRRKEDEIEHPFLKEKTTIGLLFQIQPLLLARYLRGDYDAYPAFLMK
jgi:CRISP-associated protein Cas1